MDSGRAGKHQSQLNNSQIQKSNGTLYILFTAYKLDGHKKLKSPHFLNY
jgi:hypothetical protein